MAEIVAIVTGSNTGIGRATATELARSGATVVLACRSESKTLPVVEDIKASTGNENVEFLSLDLGDFASVRAAATALLATDRPLQLLVNNAGVAGQRGMTKSGFEMTFGINHVGHFLLTSLLLDRLASSGPARIVNVSSGNHFNAKAIDFDAVRQPTRTFVGLREYDVSKLANVLFTKSLVARVDPERVSVFTVNPGPVATDVWRRMPRPIYAVYRRARRLKSPLEGARPSLKAATESDLEKLTGAYIDDDCNIKPVSNVATDELAEELWRRSEAWVAEG
jgi:NAD(P)-dependent dehydrogenase (short-subunit alcohol dehydrogenase family)